MHAARSSAHRIVGGRRSRNPVRSAKGTVAPVSEYATAYKGVVTGVKINPQSGEIEIMPPANRRGDAAS